MRAFSSLRRCSHAAISRDKCRLVRDPTIEALRNHHADLDLDHVEPAGVFRREVKLEPTENPSCLGGIEGVVERGR